MEYTALFVNIFVAAILLGGIGLTVLGLPGNVLIFLVALGYGYYEHFVHLNYTILLILFGALVVGEIIEFVAGALGAKKEQASKGAIVAAFLGTIAGGIIGTGVLPFIGSISGAILGAFAASYLAEYIKTSDTGRAGRVAQSVIKGQIIGIIVKFAIAITMVIVVLSKIPWISQ